MPSLSPASQLILKHLSDTIDKHTLIVDPLELQDINHPDFAECTVWRFREIEPSQQKQITWPNLPDFSQFTKTIVFFPKAKEKAVWLLSMLAQNLTQETQVYLVGENRSGIKTCQKLLQNQLSNLQKLASGKHCLLYRGLPKNDSPKPVDFIYQDYAVEQKSIKIASLPGIFSHGELDKGTELLLKNLPDNITGKVLDFACGCGVIGSFIGKYFPQTQLNFSDIDALAIEATKQTLNCNNLTGKVDLSNGLPKNSSKYHNIFTNPPFHTGLKIDYYISEAFIKACGRQLESTGKLYLVANRFLKYPQILQNHFDLVEVIAEDNKFKLYCAYNR